MAENQPVITTVDIKHVTVGDTVAVAIPRDHDDAGLALGVITRIDPAKERAWLREPDGTETSFRTWYEVLAVTPA